VNTEILHIPFFPLNIFLLPGEQLPLHIFEPRYRQLFEEAERSALDFGLPCEDDVLKRGFVSICHLLKVVKRYESGELDVIIEAKRIAELKDYEPVFGQKLYPGGYVREWNNEVLNEMPSDELVEVFREYIQLRYNTKPQPANIKNYKLVDLAASTALSNTDKMKLILLDSSERQDRFLMNAIKYLNLLLAQESSAENGIILN